MNTLPNTTTRAQKLALESPTSSDHSTSTLGTKRDGHAHSPFDPVNGPSSTIEITNVLDKQMVTKEVGESDGSSHRTTMSEEHQSDLPWTSLQPQVLTTQGISESEPHPPNQPSEEEVIRAYLANHLGQRHEVLPNVFDRQGRLRPGWRYLRPRIDVAKKEQRRQAAVNKKKTQSVLEAPVGIPMGFNFSSAMQGVEQGVEHFSVGESRLSFEGEDAAVVSHAQLSDPYEPIDSTLDDRAPGAPLSLLSQLNDRTSTIGQFSTQSRKTLSTLKTYGQGRNRSLKISAQKAPRRAEKGPPGRNLRSGLPAKPSDVFPSLPSLPTLNITPHQEDGQQLLSTPPAELKPPCDAPPPSPLEEVEATPEHDTITVDSSLAPRQKSPLPLPSQRDLALASPSAREQETATRLLHGRLQQHLSRNSNPCKVCRQEGCSCSATAQHFEEILCNDIACYKKWWGVEDLWNSCGIKLSDAQESKRKFNCWFCPQCSNKARVLLQYELTYSASAFISPNSSTLIQEGSGPSNRPDNGLWPEDGELQEPLQHLVGMLQQYTGNTTMACNKLSPINSQTRVLDIPCVRDEILDQSAGSANHVIRVIRKLLDVPSGVLIKDKIREVQLQDMACPIWIRSVLSLLVSEFVFNHRPPFEDATLWKQTLAEAGHSVDEAETLIHDHRIRLMKTYKKFPTDPKIPPEFRDRMTRRLQEFVEQLNATMLPLVGGGSALQVRHQEMATVALELNLKRVAYRGTFEEIKPQFLDPFNPERHAEENPGSECSDLTGKPILMTTMWGVRFKHPEKGWRTCSHAKVKMWPENNTERDQVSRVPLPDMAGGSSSQQTNRRIVPKKRQIGEVVEA